MVPIVRAEDRGSFRGSTSLAEALAEALFPSSESAAHASMEMEDKEIVRISKETQP